MAMAAAADAGNETDNGEISGRLNLRPFREVRTLWLDLTRALPGAALYHRDSWIELLSRSYGLSLWLATLHQGDRVTAGCVFARASLSRRFVALSFSDSCPPLAAEPDAARQLLTALAAGKVRRSYEIRGFGRVPGWETVECFVDW